ncbi:MAG: tetratricopeptide repeat protein [Limisphaerales bacterium]
MITALQPPDCFHLEAAQGWLELGNMAEANNELDNITAGLRAHPHVLNVRLDIYAAAKKWEAALDIAAALVRLAPEEAFGWVNRSFCLHEMKRTAEARDNLLGVVDKFPDDAIMRYNLARYECRLGRMEQANGVRDRRTEKDEADGARRPLWGLGLAFGSRPAKRFIEWGPFPTPRPRTPLSAIAQPLPAPSLPALHHSSNGLSVVPVCFCHAPSA